MAQNDKGRRTPKPERGRSGPLDSMMTQELSNRLQELRERQKLSRLEWAEKCGVTRMTIWRWETGRTIPHDYELQAALAVLDLPLRERMAIFALREETRLRGVRDSAPTVNESLVHRGDLLRALRGRKRWTQDETARAAGVTRAALTRWERYEAWPAAEKIHRLAYALGASERELLALTTGLDAFDPGEDSDEAAIAAAEARAASLVPGYAPLDSIEPEIFARMHRLSSLARRNPDAALGLHNWHQFYAHRLVAAERFAEARLYLARMQRLPLSDRPVFQSFGALQVRSYLHSFSARHHPARLREGAIALLRAQRQAVSQLEQYVGQDQATAAFCALRLRAEMALTLTYMGRGDEAVALSETFVPRALQSNTPMAPLHARALLYERGHVLRAAGRYDKVLDEFPGYLGFHPAIDSYLHLHLGAASRAVGETQSGDAHLTLALSLARQYSRDRIAREAAELMASV